MTARMGADYTRSLSLVQAAGPEDGRQLGRARRPRAGRSVQSAGILSSRQRTNRAMWRNRPTARARSAPRPRARPAPAPTTGPSWRSTGSSRPACGWSRPAPWPPPTRPTGGRRGRRRAAARRRRAATAAAAPRTRPPPRRGAGGRRRRTGRAAASPTPSPSLCRRNPPTTQSAVRWCLTLSMSRLSCRYGASAGLAITPSNPAPSKRRNQSSATSASAVTGVRRTRSCSTRRGRPRAAGGARRAARP